MKYFLDSSFKNRVGRACKMLVFSVGIAFLHTVLLVSAIRAESANLQWQTEWEKTVEAAKKEGQVNVYKFGAFAPLGIFEKTHPGIKVLGMTGRGGQVPQRVFAERRAGRYLADVVVHGVTPNFTKFYHAKILDPVRRFDLARGFR